MKIGKPIHQFQLTFQGEWPTAVAFLSNDRIAAANRAGQILVWNLKKAAGGKSPANFAPSRQLVGHTNGVTRLRVTPDLKTLVSSSLDRTVRLWDVDAKSDGKAEIILDRNDRERNARRKRGDAKKKILEAPGVSIETAKSRATLNGHKDWINALGMSADGKRIISGDDDCVTIVWDLASGKPVSKWTGYDRVWVVSAALSPKGETAFTAEFAGSRSSFDRPAAQARFWNAETGKPTLDLLKVWTPKVKDKDRTDSYGYARTWGKLMKRGLVAAEFSPDGKWLAVAQGGETDTGKVHLVDTKTGKIIRTVSGHRYGACDVTFSADSRFVLSGGRDTMVRICRVDTGKEVAALGKSRGGQFKDWMHGIAVSPDQQRVAAADIAGIIHVWKIG